MPDDPRRRHEIEQILGKALGYPWYKDDPANFPDATEADGVGVGEHTAESLADEAARRVVQLQTENAELRELVAHCWVHSGYPNCGYAHMTTAQKSLYDDIISAEPE